MRLIWLTPLMLMAQTCRPTGPTTAGDADERCLNSTVNADVIALSAPISLNRIGSAVPNGLLFALAEDVSEGALREGVRPRPLVLRASARECLNITLNNQTEEPVSLHIDGMQWRVGRADDGSDASGSVQPGATATYMLYVGLRGTHLLYSLAAPEHRDRGLFGALHVEPSGSRWYRAQVTAAELEIATTSSQDGYPVIDYDAVYPEGHPRAGTPVLAMRDGAQLVRSDLSALILDEENGSFRELTAIYHDFADNVDQAFPPIHDPQPGEDEPPESLARRNALATLLSSYVDRYALNYGGDGVANKVIANRLGLGPMAGCGTCRFEEFALSSWVSGDPGMVVDKPIWSSSGDMMGVGKAETRVLYPADPTNVLHSYFGEPVRFRILQGSGEDRVVHHQHGESWLQLPGDPGSRVIDSQPLGLGAAHTVSLPDGGQSPGDSLLHALKPELVSQGMWGIWRVHDVLELGSALDTDGRPTGRALPDGQIRAGTPIPSVVPMPGLAMPPLPGAVFLGDAGQVTWDGELPAGTGGESANPGYPFFIPGVAGSRPPQPPMELVNDGGLPRHVIMPTAGLTAFQLSWQSFLRSTPPLDARALDSDGEPLERLAMMAHAAASLETFTPSGEPASFAGNGRPAVAGAPYADPCTDDAAQARVYRAAQVEHDILATKSGWHIPQGRLSALWEDVLPTLRHERAPQPLILRAHTGDCVQYEHTNLTPSSRALDDFSARTPTDIVGQHAHLVSFDLTASSGVSGGFNYEDGAYAPGEVRDRISAINSASRYGGKRGILVSGRRQTLRAQSHPFFGDRSQYSDRSQYDALSRQWIGAQTVVQRWFVGETVSAGAIDELYTPRASRRSGLTGGLIAEPPESIWWDPVTNGRLAQRLLPDQDEHPISLRQDGGPTSWQARIEDPSTPADSFREFALAMTSEQPAYQADRGYSAGARSRTQARGAQFLTGTDEDNQQGAVNLTRTSCDQQADMLPCPTDTNSGMVTINYRAEPLRLRAAGSNPIDSDIDPTDAANVYLTVPRPNFVGHPTYNTLATQTPRVPSPRLMSERLAPQLLLDGQTEADDPYTPLLRAYMGEPVRLAVLADFGDITMHGVRWKESRTGWQERLQIGGAAEARFVVPYAEEANLADHLYTINADGADGSWGLLRAFHEPQEDFQPLSAYPAGMADRVSVCPQDAPVRAFMVRAVHGDDNSWPSAYFALENEQFFSGTLNAPPDELGPDPSAGERPLILRARAGECVRVTLTNDLDPEKVGAASTMVGMRPQRISLDVTDNSGFNAGLNPLQTISPGNTIVYTWYAGANLPQPDGTVNNTPIEFGAVNLTPPDPDTQIPLGLVGALIIEPAGSSWTYVDGDRAHARIVSAGGRTFEEAVMLHTDHLPAPDGCDREWVSAVSYASTPACGNWQTSTPAALITVLAGTPLRLRLLHPGVIGDAGFVLHGHAWSNDAYADDASALKIAPAARVGRFVTEGTGAHHEVILPSAGGIYELSGDFLFRIGDQDDGAWGILRTRAPEK